MIKYFLLTFSLFVLLLPLQSVYSQYAGGDGSAGNPYQIATPIQLQHLMTTSSDWGFNFVLTGDIDMNLQTAYSIGNFSTDFTGTFNGRGFEIKNLTINTPSAYSVGLFGGINGSNISNLGVVNASINGSGSVGILCGFSILSGITNCYTTGTVNGISNIGGFIGDNFIGTINNCYFNGTVSGNNSVGGFCGQNGLTGVITNCYSSGNVSGQESVGGFCGMTNNSTISSCYSTSTVNGTMGSNKIGGFCGYNYNSGIIRNCYSTGNAQGLEDVGGFCGLNLTSTIEYSYSIGKPLGDTHIGGFIGNYYLGTLNCNFWNTETSQTNNAVGYGAYSGITGLTSTQFQTDNVFSSCFDFDNVWVMGRYVNDSNYLFPVLRSFNYTLIPTLTEWATIIFAGSLILIGSWVIYKRII